jgi:beta-glucanase (GH16 family)
LKWSDEFSGTALDSSSWSAQVGDGSDYGITGWGNGEAEDYTADNATVSAGVLHITAVKESTTYNNTNYQYTSARLRTSGKVFKTYGYIEAKIKLPAVKGLWPAFWMLPESNYENRGWPTSGEIDIMENKGRETYKVGGTTHSANSNYGDAYHTGSTTLASSIENWHIYGVEWTDEAIAFSVDGVVYNTVSRDTWVNDCALYEGGPAPFNKPFHLILNLAVGGQYDGYTLPPSSFSSAEMLVDYVRIYQA